MSRDEPVPEIPEPRANPELLGHAAAEAALRGAFDGGRLHHAWLISGPRGIGKATLAYRFARFVLAKGPAGGGAAGLFAEAELPETGEGLYVSTDDPVFRRVAAGGHTDLLAIQRSENDRGVLRTEIVVDDVRKTQGFFHLTAGEGGWRVIVVDSADEMNTNAANALLKVLEEPPPRALLLLVSHNPGRLLPTIRSRCQKLRLDALSPEIVGALLHRYAPDMAEADIETTAMLAEGSIGRALDLAASGGLGIYGQVMDLLDGVPDLDIPALHDFAAKCAAKKGADTFSAAAELMRWTMGRLVKHVGGGGEVLMEREARLFGRIGPAASLDRWLQVWEKVDELLTSADRANLDRKQVILNAFSAVAQVTRS